MGLRGAVERGGEGRALITSETALWGSFSRAATLIRPNQRHRERAGGGRPTRGRERERKRSTLLLFINPLFDTVTSPPLFLTADYTSHTFYYTLLFSRFDELISRGESAFLGGFGLHVNLTCNENKPTFQPTCNIISGVTAAFSKLILLFCLSQLISLLVFFYLSFGHMGECVEMTHKVTKSYTDILLTL